jgi:hypothetical protein
MQGTLGRIVLGFIAAVISVLIVHQTIVYVLGMYGMSRSVPWSMQPLGYGWFPRMPTIANVAFWGGLWGILFALVYDWLPSRMAWLKGLIFGLIIVVISNWTLLPLIRQHIFNYPPQPLFSGLNPTVMLAVVLIVGGFGLGLGIIYGLIGRTQNA